MKSPRLSYIHPIDKLGATEKMIAVAREKAPTDNIMTALCDIVAAQVDNFKKNIGDKHLKEHTARLYELDAIRDNLIRSFYNIAYGESCRVNNPDRMQAAVEILKIGFPDNLNIVSMPLLTETVRYEEKIEILKSRLSAQIELLGLNDLVEDMTEANEEFSREYERRSSMKENLPKAIHAYIPEMDKAITTLVSYIITSQKEETARAIFDPMYKVEKTPVKNIKSE
ncbi:hypothetical protein KKF34_04230 [Myxococcota bacterium]|nr:hypothetical protein [Myxococcota bacterium]MBU1382895.1 hypothetical protein [Myxococcota bacterium]MBU1496065.1 hypothetical protein [Myxococcota bacterium]